MLAGVLFLFCSCLLDGHGARICTACICYRYEVLSFSLDGASCHCSLFLNFIFQVEGFSLLVREIRKYVSVYIVLYWYFYCYIFRSVFSSCMLSAECSFSLV